MTLTLNSFHLHAITIAVGIGMNPFWSYPAQAQTELAQVAEPPSTEPLPEPDAPRPLPPPEELLRPPEPSDESPETVPGEVPDTILVERFQVEGSTIFNPDLLAEVAKRAVIETPAAPAEVDGSDPMINQSLSFAQLLQARSAVTQYYTDRGYITSGAFIPPQVLDSGVVIIQVIEGRLEDIDVSVEGRLIPGYVRSRLRRFSRPPLNVDRLLEGLQLLQLDPLVQTISAELAAGARPGTSILDVDVVQADAFDVDIVLDNGRSPSVGSFRRGVQATHANLLGLGDELSVGYRNTDGSDTLDLSYTMPVNPRNGTVAFSYGTTDSEVIEDPFNFLDIQSESRFYEFTVRQPVIETPTRELALSLTASRRESESEFLEEILGEPIPFPSMGADEEGRTRISALRFAQEWTQQGRRQVIAARSQFSIGFDAFNSTINENGPDSRFFAWRGQAQWVRLLAPDTLLLVRGDLQLADGPLVPLEQFGLGGQQTVRAYRQDELLTDNGLLFSTEARLPLVRARRIDGIFQIAPFIDVGRGWNLDAPDPDPATLAALGVGLLWQQGDRLSIRLDYGLPLVDVDRDGDSLQENGFYFSVTYTPF
ncbi:MAG: ShlB/FhaC/HecB family hemolysin secretion/activation protein [Elainellaceae cyanobacterium]